MNYVDPTSVPPGPAPRCKCGRTMDWKRRVIDDPDSLTSVVKYEWDCKDSHLWNFWKHGARPEAR
jgi:hypothetical protein